MGATSGVRSALPPELTSFVGRRGQIRQVTQLLTHARLVTLTGPGGVGKTRLALRVARELASSYDGAVTMVELAGLSEPSLVTRAVAEAYGLHDRLAAWSVADLVAAMGGDRLLLVLDNCEHLVDACAALVDELLRSTQNLAVIATSRQPLGVHGEHLLPVPPLTLPDEDVQPDQGAGAAGAVGSYEAVSLFVERARASVGEFDLTSANVADVLRLCRRLDGVPLAIELAAARLRVLSLSQLVGRLDDRFTLLTSGPRAALQRQRTLQSMVDWSFDLCTPAEQRAWSVLSVFEGGFELDAAEHVCVANGGQVSVPGSVLDLVAALVDKSVVSTDTDGGHVRYRMLETIRAYGLDRLAASGDEEQVRRRHRDWFVGLAVQAAAQWFGPDQSRWLSRLRDEQANLRAALHSALNDGASDIALRLAVSLWFYWIGWGSLEEGRRWLSRALDADAPRADGTRRDVGMRVRAWRHLATMGAIHGDLDAAVRALESARVEAAQGDGLQLRADGLRAAALAAAIEGEHDRCVELLSVVVDDPVLRADDPEATVFDLEVLVTVFTALRRGEQALTAARKGLHICVEHDEDWHRAYLLSLYGIELWLQGAYDDAARAGRESLTLARSLDHAFGALCALELLAWLAVSTQDLDRAAVLFGALGPLWRSIGAPAGGSGMVPVYHESSRVALVDAMGARAYDRAARRGAHLSLEEAASYYLEDTPRPMKRASAVQEGSTQLTRRELEVADLVAHGMSNQQIAQTLVISVRTAEGHVQRILDKLGTSSRARIASWLAQTDATAGRERPPE